MPVPERLRGLREAYLTQLRAQAGLIGSGLPDEALLAELHKICGSAGVFGLREVGQAARDAHDAVEAGLPGARGRVEWMIILIIEAVEQDGDCSFGSGMA